jgi:hypothetical protein
MSSTAVTNSAERCSFWKSMLMLTKATTP